MSLQHAPADIEYPESDGKPMGETDLHRDWTMRLIALLKYRYRSQRVYISGDLLVYYVEGNPRKFIVPDAFVVKDCDPGRRRTYKTWEEGAAPHVVFEVTSRSTRKEDTTTKPRILGQIGVPEYFSYDPTSDYLDPPLQGYRLTGDQYSRIAPDSDGTLACQELALLLRLENQQLRIYDSVSGSELLTEGEAERAARVAAEAQVKQLREELARRQADH